jgi:deoxyadenosine/deoxycytidine kinase
MLKEAIKANPDCKVIIIERSLIADKNIFVKMLHNDGCIDKMEYDIYNKWYDVFIDEYRVDAIIYMDSSPEVCHQRINKRNRHGEEGIPLSYLEKCRDYHTQWLVDTCVNDTRVTLHEGLASSYKINHENHQYNVLHINSSDDVTYEGDDDKGIKWIELIKAFLGSV